MPPPPLPLSAKARRTREQPISFLMAAAVENPDLISFAAGLVDSAELPVAEARMLAHETLTDAAGPAALQYGTTPGLVGLRAALVERACRLDGAAPADLALDAGHCVLTTGSQQALYLIADTLLDPGDLVLAADPTYFVMTGTFQSLGAEVRPVPMDEGGLDVAALAADARRAAAGRPGAAEARVRPELPPEPDRPDPRRRPARAAGRGRPGRPASGPGTGCCSWRTRPTGS